MCGSEGACGCEGMPVEPLNNFNLRVFTCKLQNVTKVGVV